MNDETKHLLKPLYCFTIEKYTSIIVMLMIILLIGLNISKAYKDYTLVHNSETKAFYDLENSLYNRGTMTLLIEENEEYPLLDIIVNGESIGKFDKNKEVTIGVTDRDVVQINGSMYSDDIRISIKNISSNRPNYLNHKQILVKQNISTLAIIKM